MGTLLEGLSAIGQLCTLPIVLPSIALALIAQRRGVQAVLGFGVGVAVMAWLRAAQLWSIAPTGVVVLVLAVVTAATFFGLWTLGEGGWWATPAFGLLGGLVAGWLWRPCVGIHLADILNNAETEKTRTLALMFVFVAGTAIPAMSIALVPVAMPQWRQLDYTRWLGVGFGALYAFILATGYYDNVVSELYRLSST